MEFYQYELSTYRPEFRRQIIELQKHLWSNDQDLNAACLEWKYDNNPYLDATFIYSAFSGDQMVGMLGACGSKWKIGKSCGLWSALYFADFVIHPDHRQKGLAGKLMSFALNDLSNTEYSYVFDFGAGEEDFGLGMLLSGWRRIGYIQTAHWQVTPEAGFKRIGGVTKKLSLINSTFRRLKRYTEILSFARSSKARHSFDTLDAKGTLQARKIDSHVSIGKSPRSAEMAELVQAIDAKERLQHVRDEEYFTWRFKNPLSQYRFLFWDDGGLEGYLALQAQVYPTNGRGWANIVDWEAKQSEVLKDLLQAAIHFGNFDHLTIWSATLADETHDLLQSMGFYFLDSVGSVTRDVRLPSILAKPIRQDILNGEWRFGERRLLDLDNWDLRMIYSDDF
ncbi:GNAT family N-acetyltransferase [Candidatus Nitrospira salsa]